MVAFTNTQINELWLNEWVAWFKLCLIADLISSNHTLWRSCFAWKQKIVKSWIRIFVIVTTLDQISQTLSSSILEAQFFFDQLSGNDRKWIFLSIFDLHFNILAAVSALYQHAITHSIQNKTSWMVWPLKTHTPTYNLTPTRSTLDQHFYIYLFYQLYYGYLIRLYTLSKICLFNVILCDLKN